MTNYHNIELRNLIVNVLSGDSRYVCADDEDDTEDMVEEIRSFGPEYSRLLDFLLAAVQARAEVREEGAVFGSYTDAFNNVIADLHAAASLIRMRKGSAAGLNAVAKAARRT